MKKQNDHRISRFEEFSSDCWILIGVLPFSKYRSLKINMKLICCLQVAHVTVLTGYRLLPRKDLVQAKQYFIIDAACAAIAYTLHQVRKLDNSFYLKFLPQLQFRQKIFSSYCFFNNVNIYIIILPGIKVVQQRQIINHILMNYYAYLIKHRE